MRKMAALAIVLFLDLCACKSVLAPRANMVLDGELGQTYTSDGQPQFEGYVKNIGAGTGYNCIVRISIDAGSSNPDIHLSIAKGFPGGLGDIAPGERAYFNAVAYDYAFHDQIKHYDVRVTWTDPQKLNHPEC